MKKITIGILIAAIFTIGMVGFIFAKSGRHEGFGKHRGGFGGAGFPSPFLVEKISKEIGLSDEQQAQAKTIFEESKTRIKPLMETLKQNHESAKDLGTDGNFDEATVNQIANQQSETMKQLFIEKEKTKAQLFAILTPEQREKAKQIKNKFGEKMKGRFGHRSGGHGDKATPSEE